MTQGPATHDINLSVMTNTLERATVSFGGIQVDFVRREIRNQEQLLQVGSRAFDILGLLVNANGELVSKDEIMRVVWPTTIVEENSLHAQVSALRKVLGTDNNLIGTVKGRGYRMLQSPDRITGRDTGTLDSESVQSTETTPTLAAQFCTSSFMVCNIAKLVGRERQLTELLTDLRRHSVITLVGTGGIGKTSLALEAARQATPDFP